MLSGGGFGLFNNYFAVPAFVAHTLLLGSVVAFSVAPGRAGSMIAVVLCMILLVTHGMAVLMGGAHSSFMCDFKSWAYFENYPYVHFISVTNKASERIKYCRSSIAIEVGAAILMMADVRVNLVVIYLSDFCGCCMLHESTKGQKRWRPGDKCTIWNGNRHLGSAAIC